MGKTSKVNHKNHTEKEKTTLALPEDFQQQLKPGQSIELLKELHIVTRDGKINQDSRRKLKQVYHLFQFIEPLLKKSQESLNSSVSFQEQTLSLVDHGAGKSYLGFIIYDLFFKSLNRPYKVYGIETRGELVEKSKKLAEQLKFENMEFLNLSVADSITSNAVPDNVQVVTALHACDSATDDAIDFALAKHAQHIVLVPCCQAEVASVLRQNKAQSLSNTLSELYRQPIHTREFGSHLTNVLRVLRLTASGYDVTVTELVGYEHSMKNELIVASLHHNPDKNHQVRQAKQRIEDLLNEFKLNSLNHRFKI